MRALRADGHSLALHGATHAKADELLGQLGAQGYVDAELRPHGDRDALGGGEGVARVGRERDALADRRYEDETAYDRARDVLTDARYRDETAYKRAQAAAKAAAKAAKDAEKETGQELRQENGDRRKAEYERPQSGQGRIGQLYTEMMAESDSLGWLSTHAKDLSDEELATLWGYVKTLMK